jgi:nitrate reductase assembly molybdenum cofactor insertion protein NarJ
MDTLHTVLRAIGAETKNESAKPDHLTVFREFLAHLDEIQRKAQVDSKVKPAVKKQRAKSARRKTRKTK